MLQPTGQVKLPEAIAVEIAKRPLQPIGQVKLPEAPVLELAKHPCRVKLLAPSRSAR